MEREYPYRRCLVTGGAGFIAGHLARALSRAGSTVRALDHIPFSTATDRAVASIVAPADLAALRIAVEETRPDVVYHLAGNAHRHAGTGYSS